jgi:deoxyribonuclease V
MLPRGRTNSRPHRDEDADAVADLRERLGGSADRVGRGDTPALVVPASPAIAGAWFTSPTGSAGDSPGESAWASAVSLRNGTVVAASLVRGVTSAGYRAGYLALRQGGSSSRPWPRCGTPRTYCSSTPPLGTTPEGRPGAAPRRGVEAADDRRHRPSAARDRPRTTGGTLGDLRAHARRGRGRDRLWTRHGVRPIAVHPAWRTDRATALDVVRRVTGRVRTPEPLRAARREARLARARDEGRLG